MSLSFKKEFLRRLPAVDKILQEINAGEIEGLPHSIIVGAIKDVIVEKRSLILRSSKREELASLDFSPAMLAGEAFQIIKDKATPGLKSVLNATGVLLHTNLGRAPLAGAALEAMQRVGGSFSNLEISLKTGQRTTRYLHVEELLCHLTGAEAALVVNNNAGAVFLTLNTLASGREVIVSRGELVEIGGSFRLPEVMVQSGVRLIEVGTTNKCFLKDYQRAVNERTALLLKVHTSNYKIMGFTAAVPLKMLARFAAGEGLPVMEDLGSGLLVDLANFGLPPEPLVQDSVMAGADVVTFSGDKLLGGPQAGIIVGKKKYIERIKSNQLLRVLRVDKFVLAALEATLRLYWEPEKALKQIPIFHMLGTSLESLQARAEALVSQLEKGISQEYAIGISREKARVGGGALPLVSLPSIQLALEHSDLSSGEISKRLRSAVPPVVGRVSKNRVLLDLRSIRAEEDKLLLDALLTTLQ